MSDTAKPQATQEKSGLRIPGFAQLQRLGKSLMLPIAVLPAAGILLRLGQDDLLGRIHAPVIGPFFQAMSAAGGALFTNLPLLFATSTSMRQPSARTLLRASCRLKVTSEMSFLSSRMSWRMVRNERGPRARHRWAVPLNDFSFWLSLAGI